MARGWNRVPCDFRTVRQQKRFCNDERVWVNNCWFCVRRRDTGKPKPIGGWPPCIFRRDKYAPTWTTSRQKLCSEYKGHPVLIKKEICQECSVRRTTVPRPIQAREYKDIPHTPAERSWLEELGIG